MTVMSMRLQGLSCLSVQGVVRLSLRPQMPQSRCVHLRQKLSRQSGIITLMLFITQASGQISLELVVF